MQAPDATGAWTSLFLKSAPSWHIKHTSGAAFMSSLFASEECGSWQSRHRPVATGEWCFFFASEIYFSFVWQRQHSFGISARRSFFTSFLCASWHPMHLPSATGGCFDSLIKSVMSWHIKHS